MFTPGLILFSIYLVLQLALDWGFVKRREHDPREKRVRVLHSVWLTAATAVVVVLPSEGFGMPLFGAFVFAWLGTSVFEARLALNLRRPGEQALRAILFLLQPVLVLGLVAFWRFIDGAGFFVNMVLPFSTNHLRPLCTGFLIACGGLLTLQATRVFRVRRAKALLLALPLPVALAVSRDGQFSEWPRAS